MPKLTKAEKLLLAAVSLEQTGKRPFSAEDLVVEAWKRFPDAFSLDGYAEYPDSNRVYVEIMGSKPLRTRGWITKIGGKRYQVTEAGHLAYKGLSWVNGESMGPSVDLSREQRLLISRLLSSTALKKARADNIESIIFPDACAFWDISSRSVAKTLHGRLQSVEAVLAAVRQVISKSSSLDLGHGGDTLELDDLELLMETHALLLEMFAKELDIIRARRDERLTP